MGEMGVDDLDLAPCGYLSFRDDGVISEINQTLIGWLGYIDKKELRGKSIETIFPIAGRIFYQTHFYPLLKLHKKAEEIFFSLKGKDARELPVICNARSRVVNDIVLNYCIFVPAVQRSKYEQELLTARRLAEEALSMNNELVTTKIRLEKHSFDLDRRLGELKQMNGDLVQFGKIISHDLQEPIRKIALFTDKIVHENVAFLDKDTLGQLKKINRECFQLRQLAFNLERFISLNSPSELKERIDLNQILKNSLTKAKEGAPGVEIHFIADPLPEIYGYTNQLEILFFQLITNSIQFRDTSRTLEIHVKQSLFRQNVYRQIDGYYKYVEFIKITILDNGRGIANKKGKDLFTIQKKNDGDSLRLTFGLAFCKKVVDNHHGLIAIDFDEGAGVAVNISLPVDHA